MKNKIMVIAILVIAVIASISTFIYPLVLDDSNPAKSEIFINISVYITYFFFFVSLILLIGFAIWVLSTHLKESKNTLIGIGILVLILLISYLISSSEVSEVAKRLETSAGTSKLIGGGLVATYIFMFGCILAAVWSTISKQFK